MTFPGVAPRSGVYDYHVHSTYSDGTFLGWMVGAAADAGLDGVGIADHLVVSDRAEQRRRRRRDGLNLDRTHDRRRAAIEDVREEYDVAVFDAAEVDYHPADEARIERFLATAEFDYHVGSVHLVDGTNVHVADPDDPAAFVERYVELVEAMIDSELFAIAGHVDLPERNPYLRGEMDRQQYDRLARAFADSRTVPEVNAGRSNREIDHPADDTTGPGFFHPVPEFVAALREHDVSVTAGSDAHEADDLRERAALLETHFEDLGLEPAEVHGRG